MQFNQETPIMKSPNPKIAENPITVRIPLALQRMNYEVIN